MTVYVVERADYDESYIIGIFSSLQLAEDFAAKAKDNGDITNRSISTWVVDKGEVLNYE